MPIGKLSGLDGSDSCRFGIVKIIEVAHEGRAGKSPPYMLEFITSFGDGDDVAVSKTNESEHVLGF